MKSTTKTSSSSTPKEDASSFYRFLKPGALAQIRDSKFSAKSRNPQFKNLIALRLIDLSSIPQSLNTQNPMEKMPCFGSRIGQARCISRKKLLAIAPVFADIQS